MYITLIVCDYIRESIISADLNNLKTRNKEKKLTNL